MKQNLFFSLELGLSRTPHAAHWQDRKSHARSYSLDLDGQLHFSKKRFHPYFLTGVSCYELLYVDDDTVAAERYWGTVNWHETRIDKYYTDVRYFGWSAKVGGGAALYLIENLSLNLSMFYKRRVFGRIDGERVSTTVPQKADAGREKVIGHGFALAIVLKYHF